MARETGTDESGFDIPYTYFDKTISFFYVLGVNDQYTEPRFKQTHPKDLLFYPHTVERQARKQHGREHANSRAQGGCAGVMRKQGLQHAGVHVLVGYAK